MSMVFYVNIVSGLIILNCNYYNFIIILNMKVLFQYFIKGGDFIETITGRFKEGIEE
jgi:hypothetical protein